MAAGNDNAVIIDTSINDSKILQAFAKMQQAGASFADGTAKELGNVDKALEDAIKRAQKLKIEPTTEGIQEAVEHLDRLNATIENQKAQLGEYEREYARVSERYGDTSTKALNLQRKILSLEEQIAKNTKKSEDYASTLGDLEDAMQQTSTAADKMGKGVEDAGSGMQASEKSVGAFDIALGDLISNGIQRVIGAFGELLDKTAELRRDLSFLEQNARDAGMQMEYLHDKAGDLYAITGDTNEVVEALSNVLATGMNADKATEAIDLLAGAVVKFPETMKIESLADSLQETIATGEATGQYAELLGRLGVDVDAFNVKLGSTSSEAHRQQIALDALKKKGLDQVWQSYKDNNGQMIENAKANYELQRTYADLGKELEPLQTQLKVTLAQILVDNKDKVVAIIGAVGKFLEAGTQVLGFLSDLNPVLVIVSAGIALLVVKAASAAIGAKIMAMGVGSATQTLAAAGPAAVTAGAQFLILAADILMVAAAVWLVTSGIAALINAIRGVPNNLTINTSVIPSMGDLKNQLGYAQGTSSAMPGWRWVGERGPELMRFAGGEQVLTAAQSRAATAFSSPRGGETTVDRRQYIFKVDDIATYQAIERKLKNERLDMIQGYAPI